MLPHMPMIVASISELLKADPTPDVARLVKRHRSSSSIHSAVTSLASISDVLLGIVLSGEGGAAPWACIGGN